MSRASKTIHKLNSTQLSNEFNSKFNLLWSLVTMYFFIFFGKKYAIILEEC